VEICGISPLLLGANHHPQPARSGVRGYKGGHGASLSRCNIVNSGQGLHIITNNESAAAKHSIPPLSWAQSSPLTHVNDIDRCSSGSACVTHRASNFLFIPFEGLLEVIPN